MSLQSAQEGEGPRSFAANRYVVLRSILREPLLSFCYKYALRRAASGTMAMRDSQVPQTPSAYADAVMDMLLARLAPAVERASGLHLFPTYSYFRVYKRGDVLARHRDRPSCEVSLSLSLGYVAEKPWALWIEGPGGVSSATLEPGDGLLYRGVECFHWREAFEGEQVVQVFLHFVEQNGPNAIWKFDKREKLNSEPALQPLFGRPLTGA